MRRASWRWTMRFLSWCLVDKTDSAMLLVPVMWDWCCWSEEVSLVGIRGHIPCESCPMYRVGDG